MQIKTKSAPATQSILHREPAPATQSVLHSEAPRSAAQLVVPDVDENEIIDPDEDPKLFPPYIEACIDLEEPTRVNSKGETEEVPFKMIAGETLDVRFKYNVGIPNAHAFGVFFFETYRDSVRLQNAIILKQPAVVLSPQLPVPDLTGLSDQFGVVTITIPKDASDSTVYYGNLVIYQQGSQMRTITL